MINISEVIETNKMIEQEMSSVRTSITRLHVWQRTW